MGAGPRVTLTDAPHPRRDRGRPLVRGLEPEPISPSESRIPSITPPACDTGTDQVGPAGTGAAGGPSAARRNSASTCGEHVTW